MSINARKSTVTKSPTRANSTTTKLALAAAARPLQDSLNPETRLELLKAMTASIKKHGQRVPIVMRGREILDGNLRWNACQALGIKPKTVDVSSMGKAIDDQDLWMVLNEARRHLSFNERALLAVHCSEGSHRGVNQHSETEGLTKGEAAIYHGVSTDTMEKVAKLVKIRGMRERVLRGESPSILLREAASVHQAKQVAAIARGNGNAAVAFDDLIAKDAKLGLIYGDAPWDYGRSDGRITGNASPGRHYPTMTLDAIKALPVGKIAAKDSLCWMWVPNCLMRDGLDVLEAWGFEFVTSMVWEKTAAPPSKGAILPFHETLLVGKRGEGLKHVGKPSRSAYRAGNPGRVHSRKPAWFADEIDRLYPKAAKIELFCRTPRKGWLAWGNQVNKPVKVAQVIKTAKTAKTTR